jgi:ketosteroid isomerase-like protein
LNETIDYLHHPNVLLIHRFFAAYGTHDLNAIQDVMAENVTWSFPGNHPLSGTKRGIGEVVEFFDLMGKIMGESHVSAQNIVSGVNEEYVVECQHFWLNSRGKNDDHYWCVLWKFQDGKIIEGKHFASE